CAGVSIPDSLRLTIYRSGVQRREAPYPLAGRQLPQSLLVSSSGAEPDLRFLVEGLDAQGAVLSQATARTSLPAGEHPSADLPLAEGCLEEADGDGIPDAIDDPPMRADGPPCRVAGRTFFVSPGGDDKAAGTQAQPFRTLRRGADALAPGDVLLVAGGVYVES